MEIKITVNDREAKDLINKLKSRLEDMTSVMSGVSGTMLHAVEENFAREGRPKWPGLAESTKKQRARKGHWPGKILQMSGQLASSVMPRFDRSSATVGTNKSYAAIQQFGGVAGKGHKAKIPARPFMALAEEDTEAIMMRVKRYITEGLK